MADRPAKVLVIGLDGGTLSLLKPWVEEGHLPVLDQLMAQGAAGDLHTVMPPITAAAWTSFATGKGIGTLMAMSASLPDYDMLWSAVVIVSVLSALAYAAVGLVERRVLLVYAPEQLA